MDKKLLIIAVAALSQEPEVDGLKFEKIQSIFPAVTCAVQASFRTASLPSAHGMIANGLFFRNINRPMFWEQSANLVQGPRIWDDFRNSGKRVGMLFWQQSLGEEVDILLSPAPIHKHGGGMIQGCYCKPENLYETLCRRIGTSFKLQQYWGPLATWKVGNWIVDATAAVLEDPDLAPDLCFTYLPTLDYVNQRKNPDSDPACQHSHQKLENQLKTLMDRAAAQGYDILIFGDYSMQPVDEAVFPNQILRDAGLMSVRKIKGMLYPDFHASRAFAVTDHEIAHVYVFDPLDISGVWKVLLEFPGIGEILDRETKKAIGVNHPKSGELVLIAENEKWFAYPWWLETEKAPDYTGHVDIHNKPGYDPCELFFGWPPGTVSRNTTRIKGSHGRIGPGREVVWASTFSIPGNPGNLVDLAASVRKWLSEGD